jgi:hypothetical protein
MDERRLMAEARTVALNPAPARLAMRTLPTARYDALVDL